jgi:hypothetical protein
MRIGVLMGSVGGFRRKLRAVAAVIADPGAIILGLAGIKSDHQEIPPGSGKLAVACCLVRISRSACLRKTSIRIRKSHRRLSFSPRPPDAGPEGPLPYCRPGVFPFNPARRNASAIASPLAGTELLRPARVSAGRRRFSDSIGAISARAVVGRASGA